ncbi:MAG: beta-lactamase family protein [Gemmatimonadales bacterium]|nr:beta-lactamase family protein [Gemmatimonadales bacterium]
MRATFDSSLHRQGIVGGSLWFISSGQVLAHDGFGLADEASRRPVTDSTIYHWASVTKTFTAIAIMQLRDRGLLRLDDPAVKYVPELRAVRDTFGDIDAVTIRHLMSHSGGFRNGTWPYGGDKPWHPFEPTRWEQLVAMMPYTEILFRPGSRFGYSNPGIIYLGRVIEALSGDDYEVYVDKNILKPLGMTHSYFDGTPYHLLRQRSNGYEVASGRKTAVGLSFDTGITVSNGGLNAPLTDMARYVAFLAGAPDAAGVHEGVLKRGSLEEMWKPLLPVGGGNTEGDSVTAGLFSLDAGGRRYLGKTGSQAGFRSFIYFDPVRHTAAAGVTNTSGTGPAKSGPEADAQWLLLDIRNELLARIFPLFR